ncbi:MAG: phage tail tip lysozyme [Oscillospiraceae bacterium]|nr:phage tail tip lysozyme [Oscillospiraceae bacterium]
MKKRILGAAAAFSVLCSVLSGTLLSAGDAFLHAKAAVSPFHDKLLNSTSLGDSSQRRALAEMGDVLYNEGYELAFIAGMLGNFACEGSFGLFESSNYSSGNEPAYLVYMDENWNYRSKYSGQNIVNKNLSEVYTMVCSLEKDNYKGKFGLGCAQWTGERTKNLLKKYMEIAGGSSSITMEQVTKAEGLFMVQEIKTDFKNVYSNWKTNNADNLNTRTAAGNAGRIVCTQYERPSDRLTKQYTRGRKAEDIYTICGGSNAADISDQELGIPYPRPDGSTLIQKGSKGSGVCWVQYALEKLGYATQYGDDGDFGTSTETVVKQFQAASGLGADGQVGAGTIQKIVERMQAIAPSLRPDTELGIPYPRPTGSPVLQKGSTGDDVRWVQYALEMLGYATQYGADGDFGSATESIVKQFQANNGLDADGKVGSATVNMIVSKIKSLTVPAADTELGIPYPRPTGSPVLQKGSKGDDVRWLQYALEKLGYTTPYGTDGDFGSATESIVKQFQTANGLDADGMAGPATIQKIVQRLKGNVPAETTVTKTTTKATTATTATKATTAATRATTAAIVTTTTAKAAIITTAKTTTTAAATTTTTAITTTTTTVTLPELSIPENAVILQPAEQYQIMPNHDNCLFSSSKPGVAVVSGRGIVTALTAGTAIISVINPDGDVVQLTVTVEPPLALEQEAVVLHPAEQYTIQPSKADCTFVSSDKSVAVVSPSGVVTALTVGTATISVISPGNETLELLVTVLDEDIIIGDCNGDGDIDVIDVVVLARFISEDPEIFISIEGRICADADRNGKLDNNDITKILRIIARLDD